jgi:hypothetical protein
MPLYLILLQDFYCGAVSTITAIKSYKAVLSSDKRMAKIFNYSLNKNYNYG